MAGSADPGGLDASVLPKGLPVAASDRLGEQHDACALEEVTLDRSPREPALLTSIARFTAETSANQASR